MWADGFGLGEVFGADGLAPAVVELVAVAPGVGLIAAVAELAEARASEGVAVGLIGGRLSSWAGEAELVRAGTVGAPHPATTTSASTATGHRFTGLP